MQLKQHICASKVMLSNLNHCFSSFPTKQGKGERLEKKKGTSVECQESNEPIISPYNIPMHLQLITFFKMFCM
jgi:hypothetical protein